MKCKLWPDRNRTRDFLMTAAVLWLLYPPPALPATPIPGDAHFRAQYSRQYDLVKSLAPDMVVEEVRLRVEEVASRGSQVNGASNDRRVRGFESVLRKGLQETLCPGGKPRPGMQERPSPAVFDSVIAAANTQQLRTSGDDLAELTALAQRLVDSLPPARWCVLKSLDEIR